MLVFAGAALCLLSGIGIGTFIATFTQSAEQAQLTSFFVESANVEPLRRIDPHGGHASLDAAAGKVQPDLSLWRYLPSQHVEGERPGNTVAKLSRIADLYRHPGFPQRLAIPEAAWLRSMENHE